MLCKRLTRLLGVFLVLGLLVGHVNADLVGNWKFDDGAGNTAIDKSGNGNDGTLIGGPTWIAGTIGSGALSFDGSDDMVEVPDAASLDLPEALTIAAWVNLSDLSTYYFVVHKGPSGTAGNNYPGNFALRTAPNSGTLQLLHQTGEGQTFATYNSDSPIAAGQWYHVAATLVAGGQVNFYIDGAPAGTANQSETFGVLNDISVKIGGRTDSYSFWNGAIDDVQIYNHALTAEEIQTAMNGLAFEQAVVDSPEDGAVDVLRDVRLNWIPGIFANTHNVYLGTAFDDVDAADVDNPMGVLVSQGQADESYDAGILDYGQTYYWRIDEVNGAPDNTVFKGEVWSFTAEPFAIPVATITATASSSNAANMGPENTINGVGLDELDQHSTEPTEMWLSGVGDPTPSIQYEFDKAYKLHEMLVWNSNQVVEAFVGIGAKDVVIEYSLDGAEWTILEGATQFAQAPGAADYVANTIVDFGGAMAQYVKITVNTGWGMMPQFGLSEVRFNYIPTFAREPQPANGEPIDGAEVELSWRAGREAAAHEVLLGTDPADLALATTISESTYTADTLDYDTTYYWQIVEVNDNETPSSYAGPIWRFTTPAFGTVDSFDQYDDDCNRIFFAWADGIGHSGSEDIEGCDVPPSNGDGGGAIVGNATAPFAERTIVYAGTQAMPLEYDSSFGLSEATRTFEPAQDWTKHGVESLSLFFRGASENNGGQLYVKINNTKISYDADPVNLSRAIWHPWTIDLSTVGGNLSNVSSLTIGIEGAGAAGAVYIDEIRLYPLLAPHAAFDHIPVFSATATSSLGGNFNRMDVLSIDGSGLNADGSHTVAPDGFMWLSNGTFTTPQDLEPEIVFDLGAVYSVDTMLVWNYNEAGAFTLRGVGTADILTAGADGVFSSLIANQTFDEAPGTGDIDFHQTIDLAGVKAQFIKLDISSNLGGDNDFVGLSEVQFEGTLSP